jgi:hypothetical protein
LAAAPVWHPAVGYNGGVAELSLDVVDDGVMMIRHDAFATGGAQVLHDVGNLGDGRAVAHRGDFLKRP